MITIQFILLVLLLLKKDNGSALNDEAVNSLLARNGIVSLLSFPATPSYNGAC